MAFVHPVNRNPVDSSRVGQAFSRQAADYDAHVIVQRRVVRGLLHRLAATGPSAGPVLDIGCGTGELSRQLRRNCPGLKITLCDLAHGMTRHASGALPGTLAVDADAQALPLRDGLYGLVISSSVYQWINDLPSAFAESHRVLRPGGGFAFALFGGRTLHELRECYRRAAAADCSGNASHLQEFPNLREVGGALDAAGFETLSLESVDEVEHHADVPELLRHLKRIGAGNAARNRPAGMARRRLVQRMMVFYRQRYGVPGSIPATYEVIYGLARRPLS